MVTRSLSAGAASRPTEARTSRSFRFARLCGLYCRVTIPIYNYWEGKARGKRAGVRERKSRDEPGKRRKGGAATRGSEIETVAENQLGNQVVGGARHSDAHAEVKPASRAKPFPLQRAQAGRRIRSLPGSRTIKLPLNVTSSKAESVAAICAASSRVRITDGI